MSLAKLAGATAIGLTLATPAWAQEAPAPAPVTTANSPQATSDPLEIVVTARKTQERLTDAPVAVSVITSQAIAERGLNSIDDFARNATGISFSQAFGRTTDRPVIRGQSNVLAGVQFGVETGAAYFIDGIYYQGDIQGFDPLSIERVEIIKGPQSALYGRNTYSGAINYITKDPTRDLTVSGRARLAEHNERELALSLSGQLVPDLIGFRVGGRHYYYDGEYRNQLNGQKVGQEQTNSLYGTLTVTPSPDIKLRARAAYQKDKDGTLALFLQGADANNCSPGFRSIFYRQPSSVQPLVASTANGELNNRNQYFCGAIQARPNGVRLNTSTVNTPFGPRDGTAFDGSRNKQVNLSANLDWDIGGSGWVVSSLTGYRDNKNLFGADSDHSEAYFFLFPPALSATSEPAFANTNRDEQNDFSQEVRIASPADKPIRAMVGAYYFKQKLSTVDLTFANPTAGEALGTNGSAYSTIEDKALFGLVGIDLTRRLTVTGELRYAVERKTVIDRAAATSIFCAGETGRAAQFGFAGACLPRGKFTGLDPRITVDFKPSDDTLIYAVFAQGRKPGGFNGTGGQSALALTGEDLTTYQQEKARGGEIGAKLSLADKRVFIGVAAFYNKLSAVQLTRSIAPSFPGQTTTSVAVNSGNARNQGVEIELGLRPARGINLRAGYSYVDAKFTKGCDFDFFVLNSGGLQPNFSTTRPTAAGLALCNISGKQLPLGSKHMLNGSADWEAPLSAKIRLVTNAGFSWESRKFVQTDNRAFVPAAFLLNARVGVKTDNITISLFGRNLTDEDAPSLATRWFDYRYGNAARGAPATDLPSGSPLCGGLRCGAFDGAPARVDTGAPRAFFAPLRKSRTFGVEATMSF